VYCGKVGVRCGLLSVTGDWKAQIALTPPLNGPTLGSKSVRVFLRPPPAPYAAFRRTDPATVKESSPVGDAIQYRGRLVEPRGGVPPFGPSA
jgi:hypothetical protein